MALYTTRQKYRRADLPSGLCSKDRIYTQQLTPRGLGRNAGVKLLPESAEVLEYTLLNLYKRSVDEEDIPLLELKDALRQAANLICSCSKPRLSLIHYLVALPFQIFTKETIQLGVSLWLGVINENPSTEPRVLAEVMEAWEGTIQRRKGLFDPSFG